MKLIDVLVRELPKYGGWPVGVGDIEMLSDGTIYFDGDEAPESFKLPQCDDGWSRLHSARDYSNAVTRDQYEAALAVSKTGWDGEGLPPVGCRVEANYGGEWVEATVAYTERPEAHGDAVAWKEVLVFDSKTTRPFWTDEFRPIRSEADKKRDEAIESIKAMLMYDYGDDPRLNDAVILYDAIAAGKIPHIRID